jgi:hypothetical protein
MDEEYISVNDAAVNAGVTTVTIRAWCKRLGAGIKVGGRIKVKLSVLNKIMAGEIHYDGYQKKTRKTKKETNGSARDSKTSGGNSKKAN